MTYEADLYRVVVPFLDVVWRSLVVAAQAKSVAVGGPIIYQDIINNVIWPAGQQFVGVHPGFKVRVEPYHNI